MTDARVPYLRDELREWINGGWRGDDFAIFRYKPARFQRDGFNAATQLVLDFKDNLPAARDEVLSWCIGTITNLEDELRALRAVAYVVALPRSVANAPNAPCEWIAAKLAPEFPWLTHLPQALVRTTSIVAAHRSGVRPTVEDHLQTIRYAGPPLGKPNPVEGLFCRACRKQFHTQNGLEWHVENNAHHARAVARAEGSISAGVLMLDDVITKGATSAACREILLAAGAKGAVGFFVARTG